MDARSPYYAYGHWLLPEITGFPADLENAESV
jgi:hypothetical protein